MEQDVENMVHENAIVLFDDRMLSKLRGCNIVPRSPSDFQVFVKSLAGDTISDEVILEAWKQIYPNTTADVSLPTPERECESQELILYNSSSDENVADPVPEYSKINSRKVPKQRDGSDSGVQIFEETEMSSSKNEVKMTDMYASFIDMATEHPIGNQSITLHSYNPDSRREMIQKISCPVEKTKLSCGRKSVQANPLVEGFETEEENSSDCEIIEIVSPDITSANTSNSGFDIVSDTDGQKSDSDESVEILYSTNSGEEKSMEKSCPIHRSESKVQPSKEWNCSTKQKSMYKSGSVESNGKGSCEESVNKGKQQKDKKGRRGKYKMLRSEVKHLKSVLLHLLLSLKSSTMKDSEERTGCKTDDNFSFILVNSQNARKSKFSPKESRKETGNKSRSKTSSTEKLRASAFVEVNMSRKTIKSPPKKKNTAKHTKNSSEQPPITVELDSHSSDADNGKRKKFLWRENITYVLRTKPGKWMPVEKLKRIVIARYYYCRGNVSQNTSVKFNRYLHSTAGVVVDGDMAMYSNKPVIKVSSKSEKKKFVVKTHTTTKEYKVS